MLNFINNRYRTLHVIFALTVLTPCVAGANTADGFLAAMQQTLRNPDIYLRSTIPFAPLLTHDNELVQFYPGTAAAQRHLCEAIANAKEEILITAYEWSDEDEASRMVLRALEARALRAIDEAQDGPPLMIRIVVNDTTPARKIVSFGALRKKFASLLSEDPEGEHVLIEVSRYTGYATSVVHAKYAVIDGTEALVRTNNFMTKDGVERDFYNFSAHLRGPVARIIRDDWLSLRLLSTVVEQASHHPEAWLEPLPLATNTSSSGRTPVVVLSRGSRFSSAAEKVSNPQNAGLLTMIRNSEHEILSLNPALNVPAVKKALVEAILERGVEVTLILSLNMNRAVQHWLQGGDNADTIYELLDSLIVKGGKAAADKLHVLWASNNALTPAAAHALGNNHAKTALYDNEALWIGSMNWDWQSWNNSRELSIVIFDAAVAPKWKQDIWTPIFAQAAPLRRQDLPMCGDRQMRDRPACWYLPLRSL